MGSALDDGWPLGEASSGRFCALPVAPGSHHTFALSRIPRAPPVLQDRLAGTRGRHMGSLFETDWGRLFRPEMSLPEVAVRGTLVYVSLCLLLRVILKR